MLDLVADIGNMPTGYFEAKPQRAVGFNEVALAVIPNTASQELKSGLEENSIVYREYDPSDENSRLNTLNSYLDTENDIRWSRRVDEFDEAEYTEIYIDNKQEYAMVMSAIMQQDNEKKYYGEVRKVFAYNHSYLYTYANDKPIIISKIPKKYEKESFSDVDRDTDKFSQGLENSRRRYGRDKNSSFGNGNGRTDLPSDGKNFGLDRRRKRSNGERYTETGDNDNQSEEIEQNIRRSLNNTQSADELVKENAELKEAIEILRQEFKLTEGHKLNSEQIKSMSKGILRRTSSSYDLNTLIENLTKIYDYIANDEQPSFDIAIEAMADLAKAVLSESSVINKDLYNEYEPMRKYFRETAIRLSDTAKQEIGDFNSFRKENFGRIKFRNDGIELDSLWGEISEMFPEFFPEDANEAEQALYIADALDAIQPRVENPYGYDLDESAYDLALDLYDKYFNIAEIHTYADKQKAKITALRSQYNEKIREKHLKDKADYEKRLKEAKEEYQRRIKNVKTVRDAKISLIQQANADRRIKDRRKRIETENKQNLRRQIIKKTKRLNSLLVNPTDQKHIPQALVSGILEFSKAMSDTGMFSYKQLDRLKTAYEAIEKVADGADYDLRGFYDESMPDLIDELKNTLDGRKLSKLDVGELKKLKQLVDHISHMVKTENTLFCDEKKQSVAEKAQKVRENADKKGIKGVLSIFNTKGGELARNGLQALIKPVYFFEHIGGELQELYNRIYDGQGVYAKTVNSSREVFRELAVKYHYYDWCDETSIVGQKPKRTFELTTDGGKTVNLSTEEALSLYATAKREQGRTHLLSRGFLLEDGNIVKAKKKDGKLTYDYKDNTPIRLTENDLMKISKGLTAEQKAFADEAVKYLSNDMAKLGNEVSMDFFGIEKYNEKYYFPIRVGQDSLFSKQTDMMSDNRIKHAGFTNTLKKNAQKPLNIYKFGEVWGGHCEEMARYYAFARSLEDFNRVYNYVFKDEDIEQDDIIKTDMKTVLRNTYGDEAISYINQLMKDINGGVITQPDNFLSKMTSKFKRNAVMLNMSVAIQQPSAIARALAYIDPKYFLSTTLSGRGDKTWEEIKQYAPGVGIVKEMGYYDTGMGVSTTEWIVSRDYDKLLEKKETFGDYLQTAKTNTRALLHDSSFRDDFLTWLPGKMDKTTWCHIWNACKAEVADKTGLEKEELLKKAGERFTEVIEHSQVYDSVFSRSQIMRSKNPLTQMATAFMSEPLTSLNMVADAFSKRKYDKKYTVSTIAAVVCSIVLNSMLVSLVRAARDDDEDKSYLEKYLANFVSDIFQGLNPLNYIPYIRDIVNLVKGYDINRTDMNMFSDIVNEVSSLGSAFVKANKDEEISEEEWKDIGWKSWNLVSRILAIIGVPASNVTRDTMAMFNTFKYIFKDDKREATKSEILNSIRDEYDRGIPGIFINPKSDYEQLYDAMIKGDNAEAEKIRRNILVSGNTEKDIEDNIKKVLQGDERIIKAAEARRNGDTAACVKYQQQVIKDGFELNSVVSAVNSVVKKLDKAKADDTKTDNAKTEKEEDAETYQSLYSSYDIVKNIDAGDYTEVNKAIADIYATKIKKYMAQGKKPTEAEKSAKASIKSSITSEYKERYVKGTQSERMAIRSRLLNIKINGKRLYSADEISNWAKK